MRRFFVLLLAVAMLLPTLTTYAQAVSYSGSSQYRAGKYYDRLVAVRLTGDQRTDIVNIAASQVGYQEGNSTNQLGGEILGSTNFTEYGSWYGAQDMWCAMFVSWCANLAGVSQSVIPTHAFTPNGLQHFRQRNQDHSPEEIQNGDYTPRAGDLIYFKNGRNANRTNHVGLVTDYRNGRIFTIEGNVGSVSSTTNDGMVARKSYPITNEFIVAVCCPAYPTGGTNVAESKVDGLRDALYALESGGCYDHVSQICGTLTLGAGLWSGEDGRALLESILEADPESLTALKNTGLAQVTEPEIWEDFCPTEAQTEVIAAILSGEAGVRCQDSRMERQLEKRLVEAQAMGITDTQAALLCAGLLHLNGQERVDAMLATISGDVNVQALIAADPVCRTLCRYL